MNLAWTACGVNMANRIIFVALLLSTFTKSLQEDVAQINGNHEDDHYDVQRLISDSEEIQQTVDVALEHSNNLKEKQITDLKIMNIKSDREELTTERQVAKYEVTELVIDIPDPSTKRVPIISNFTLTRPLNLAGTLKNNINNVEAKVEDEGDEIINSILIPNILKMNKNNQGQNEKGIDINFHTSEDEDEYFGDSNSKDSFEKVFDKEFGSVEEHSDDFEGKQQNEPRKSFKDHFHNFRKSIVREFKSVVDKHKDGIHDSLHKIVHGPISFFDKLHRKSSDLVKKVHNAVSRRKFQDNEEDTEEED